MRATEVGPPQAYHAEGPCWWPRWGGLRYVDMLAGDVLSLHDDGSVTRHPTGSRIAACIRPRGRGGAIVATETGFAFADRDDLGDLRQVVTVLDDPALRFNEGGCDPSGVFHCGTMAYDQTPRAASLYRWSAEEGVRVVERGLTVSNGLGWSPDGRRAYLNDSGGDTVWTYDWSPETGLTRRRSWVRLPESAGGVPDGLCVDQEGGVWVAVNGGSAVHRYDAAGTLSERVELPVTQPTACTFGGPDLGTLYITTSRENLDDDEQPLAGAVFTCRPGVGGLPALPCAD